MESDKPEGTLLTTVGTQGVCVFAWERLTELELEDVLEVIQEFLVAKGPNSFTVNGERTGKRITVQAIRTKATSNQGGEKQGRS